MLPGNLLNLNRNFTITISTKIVGFAVLLTLVALGITVLAKEINKHYMVERLESGRIFQSVHFSDDIKLQPSVENIDLAMSIFAIDRPKKLLGPKLNLNISDRGLTFGSSLNESKEVEIGPPAFTSWSILGSTLGHEIEVHCKQSFGLIWMSELFHLQGTVIAERQAYEYEENNAMRFGLSGFEKSQIKATKEYHYPISFLNDGKLNHINNLVAKLLFADK